jgi:hypothetical protein
LNTYLCECMVLLMNFVSYANLGKGSEGLNKGESALRASRGMNLIKRKFHKRVHAHMGGYEITTQLAPLQDSEICTLRFNDV